MKACRTCGVEKPEAEFDWANKAEGWRRLDCKPCTKAIRKAQGNDSASYQRALRRLRDLHRSEFAHLLADERTPAWDGSYCPDSVDWWRGRWAASAAAHVDTLTELDEARAEIERLHSLTDGPEEVS